MCRCSAMPWLKCPPTTLPTTTLSHICSPPTPSLFIVLRCSGCTNQGLVDQPHTDPTCAVIVGSPLPGLTQTPPAL